MDRDEGPLPRIYETERLLLRPWQLSDAKFQRHLWMERDPRVPPHRRIGSDGRPSVAELEDRLRTYAPVPAPGLLVVESKATAVALGYCGLVSNSVGQPEEPELAFELLRMYWNKGLATEASMAVIDQARAIGYPSLASTVRRWNTPSLRVLEKLGFVNTGQKDEDVLHGDSLLLKMVL